VFRLDDLPNYTEFTSLFDQYRIAKVKLEFIPTFNCSNLYDMQNGNPLVPNIQSAIDYDDISLANEDAILQYQTRVLTRGEQIHTRTLKPKPQIAAYNSALAFGYASAATNPWIDTSSPDVPHYGLKVYIDPVTLNETSTWLYRVIATYWLEVRGFN
jgi:hypothetical protein